MAAKLRRGIDASITCRKLGVGDVGTSREGDMLFIDVVSKETRHMLQGFLRSDAGADGGDGGDGGDGVGFT